MRLLLKLLVVAVASYFGLFFGIKSLSTCWLIGWVGGVLVATIDGMYK